MGLVNCQQEAVREIQLIPAVVISRGGKINTHLGRISDF